MPRQAVVIAVIGAMLSAACGGAVPPSAPATGATSPAAATPAATVPIDTVVDDGTAVAEIGRAASSDVAAAGATIAATGSNGLTYTLTVPEGSVLTPTPVTLTPVRELRGLDGGPPVMAAARLEPAGSVFATPLDLAIPYTGTPAAGEIVYSVISSDGGTTWDAFPARIENGAVHVQVFHFSHIALVVGGFDGNDLAYLNATTSATDEFRRRVAREAVGRSASEAIPLVRPILRDWLTHLRDRAQEQASKPIAEIQADFLLRLVSDRAAMYTSITSSLETFLSSGELDSLLTEDATGVLLANLDASLGTAMENAIKRAAAECAVETDRELRWRIASEQFGWFAIAHESAFLFGLVAENEILNSYDTFIDAVCPSLQIDLQLDPKPIETGDTPRITGRLGLRIGHQELTASEFLAGARFELSITMEGLDDADGFMEAVSDGSGPLDLVLPRATRGDVRVRVLTCFQADAAAFVYPCKQVELSAGSDDEADLGDGKWAGTLSGGNITNEEPVDADFGDLEDAGEQSDGSHAWVERGRITFPEVDGLPDDEVLTLTADLEIRVYPDGRLRATVQYENIYSEFDPDAVECAGIMVSDGTLSAEGDRMTFVFNSGDCLKGSITLDLARFF